MYKSKYDEVLDRAAKHLRQFGFKPGNVIKIFSVLEHTSRSGMVRRISAFIMKDNEPLCIAREARVSGCGMDMGFHLAYSIYLTFVGEDRSKYPYQTFLEHRWM